MPVRLKQPHVDVGGSRVLGHVLQRLKGAEVHGGLGVLREPSDPVTVHAHGHLRLASLGRQSRHQPLVGQERWIDPPGQVPEIVERLGESLFRLLEEAVRLLGVSMREGTNQSHLHRERDELLLRPVVDVALDLPTLLVLSDHEALARGTQLLDQSNVA